MDLYPDYKPEKAQAKGIDLYPEYKSHSGDAQSPTPYENLRNFLQNIYKEGSDTFSNAKSIGADLATGAVEGAKNLAQFIPDIVPGQELAKQNPNIVDANKMFGTEKNPSFFSQSGLLQGAGKATTFPIAGAERLGYELLSPLAGRIFGRGISGAGAGASFGATESPENRSQGAITGGLLGGSLGAATGISNVVRSLLPSNIAESIVNTSRATRQHYNNLYNAIFGEANQKGLNHAPLSIPKIDTDLIRNNSSRAEHQSLLDFNENPTLENAHIAQSDMGKLASKYQIAHAGRPLPSSQLRTMQEAMDAQNNLRGIIRDRLGNHADLSERYEDVTHGYGRHVIPYSTNRALNDYQRNKISANTLVNKLGKNEEFRMAVGRHHPELRHRDILKKLLNAAKVAAPLGAVAYGGYKAINSIAPLLAPNIDNQGEP